MWGILHLIKILTQLKLIQNSSRIWIKGDKGILYFSFGTITTHQNQRSEFNLEDHFVTKSPANTRGLNSIDYILGSKML